MTTLTFRMECGSNDRSSGKDTRPGISLYNYSSTFFASLLIKASISLFSSSSIVENITP